MRLYSISNFRMIFQAEIFILNFNSKRNIV